MKKQRGGTLVYIVGFLALVFGGVFVYGYLHNKASPNPVEINSEILPGIF